jgi:hypothetical protein
MMPNGDLAPLFDGLGRFLEVPSQPELSVTFTGALTIEAWIRPDTLRFPRTEGSGYVHWLGKGAPGKHEYVCRMYSTGNSEGRGNRISGYCFNKIGGIGVGSYFQDPIEPGQWIHYLLSIVAGGNTTIWRDGVQRDTDPLAQLGIVPEGGTAPLRIGTRDKASFFLGGIGKVALYNQVLPATRVLAHYQAMVG